MSQKGHISRRLTEMSAHRITGQFGNTLIFVRKPENIPAIECRTYKSPSRTIIIVGNHSSKRSQFYSKPDAELALQEPRQMSQA